MQKSVIHKLVSIKYKLYGISVWVITQKIKLQMKQIVRDLIIILCKSERCAISHQIHLVLQIHNVSQIYSSITMFHGIHFLNSVWLVHLPWPFHFITLNTKTKSLHFPSPLICIFGGHTELPTYSHRSSTPVHTC